MEKERRRRLRGRLLALLMVLAIVLGVRLVVDQPLQRIPRFEVETLLLDRTTTRTGSARLLRAGVSEALPLSRMTQASLRDPGPFRRTFPGFSPPIADADEWERLVAATGLDLPLAVEIPDVLRRTDGARLQWVRTAGPGEGPPRRIYLLFIELDPISPEWWVLPLETTGGALSEVEMTKLLSSHRGRRTPWTWLTRRIPVEVRIRCEIQERPDERR